MKALQKITDFVTISMGMLVLHCRFVFWLFPFTPKNSVYCITASMHSSMIVLAKEKMVSFAGEIELKKERR